FGRDKTTTSTCYGICAAAWPPVLTKGAPSVGPGLNASLLGTTKRKDGSLQVTYNHHPLYFYSADKHGKIMCQHAVMHGGIWLVPKASGTPNMRTGKMHMSRSRNRGDRRSEQSAVLRPGGGFASCPGTSSR